jgi:tetratricopeptide (TPR) repeat protein
MRLPAPQRTGSRRAWLGCLVWILSVLLGVGLGWGFYQLQLRGSFIRWQPLEGSPDKAVEIVSVPGCSRALVRVQSGAVSECSTKGQACVEREEPVTGWPATVRLAQEGVFSPDRLPPLAHVVDMETAVLLVGDAGLCISAFAVTETGALYAWEQFSDVYSHIGLCIFCPAAGALTGFLVGIPFFWLVRRKQWSRRPPADGDSPSKSGKVVQNSVLTHPLTLAALALLALNDHLLRRLWPSPITGKLGDFAWLFFAPLVLSVLLELAWPSGRRSDRFCSTTPRTGGVPVNSSPAGLLGFALVGGIFALAKTVPACHAAVVAAASALFGFPVGWRRDPTDLVALLALAPAWWTWQRARRQVSHDAPTHRLRVGFVIAVAAGLTVANGPPRWNPGINNLWVEGGQVFAEDGIYQEYRSTDGGMTWTALTWPEINATDYARSTRAAASADLETRQAEPATVRASREPSQAVTPSVQPGGPSPVVSGRGAEATSEILSMAFSPDWAYDSRRPNIVYRSVTDEAIYRSQDRGKTWRLEVRLSPFSEAEKEYFPLHSPKQEGGTVRVEDGWPSGGIVDPSTGSAIFAMGHRGVLVRRNTGEWWWIPVGPYHRMPAPSASPGPLRAETPAPSEVQTPSAMASAGSPTAADRLSQQRPESSEIAPSILDESEIPSVKCSSETDYAGAIAHLDAAIKSDPNDQRALRLRGFALNCLCENERALADLNKAIQLKPDDFEALEARAILYESMDEPAHAIADWTSVIERRPDLAEGHDARGYLYAAAGEYDLAIADFSRAIELAPDKVEYLNNRGTAYSDRGDPHRAIADFENAIRLDPRKPLLHCNLGLALMQGGDPGAASAALTRCRDLGGGPTACLLHKATNALLWAQREPPPGVILLRPDYFLFNPGEEPCETDAARDIATLDEAIRTMPDYALAYLLRGRVKEESGLTDEAMDDYDTVLKLSDDPDLRAQAREALGGFTPVLPLGAGPATATDCPSGGTPVPTPVDIARVLVQLPLGVK